MLFRAQRHERHALGGRYDPARSATGAPTPHARARVGPDLPFGGDTVTRASWRPCPRRASTRRPSFAPRSRRERWEEFGFQAALGAPIVVGGEILGVVIAFRTHPDDPSRRGRARARATSRLSWRSRSSTPRRDGDAAELVGRAAPRSGGSRPSSRPSRRRRRWYSTRSRPQSGRSSAATRCARSSGWDDELSVDGSWSPTAGATPGHRSASAGGTLYDPAAEAPRCRPRDGLREPLRRGVAANAALRSRSARPLYRQRVSSWAPSPRHAGPSASRSRRPRRASVASPTSRRSRSRTSGRRPSCASRAPASCAPPTRRATASSETSTTARSSAWCRPVDRLAIRHRDAAGRADEATCCSSRRRASCAGARGAARPCPRPPPRDPHRPGPRPGARRPGRPRPASGRSRTRERRPPPAEVEATLYFVVAESLTNVAKNARASRAVNAQLARRGRHGPHRGRRRRRRRSRTVGAARDSMACPTGSRRSAGASASTAPRAPARASGRASPSEDATSMHISATASSFASPCSA